MYAMGMFISTDDLQNESARDRFFLWNDLVSRNVLAQDIEYRIPDGQLYGSIQTAEVGELLLAKVQCSKGQNVSRSKNQIAKTNEDMSILCMQVAGTAVLRMGDQNISFCQGDWTLCDCLKIYAWHFPDNHGQLVLKLPKRKLDGRLNLPELAHGIKISSTHGVGKITWDFLNSMWTELAADNATLDARFEDITLELVATAVNEYAGIPKQLSRSHAVRLVEVKNFIKAHLKDPGLYVESIASALHISPRYLHLLFQKEQTSISQYIRDMRLDRCARNLENPSFRYRSITEIAFAWGFNNHAHFSKLFKKRYGLSARDYRKIHLPE